MKILQGVSVSSGIGTGSAFVIADQAEDIVPRFAVAKTEIEDGWRRFQTAVQKVSQFLESQKDAFNAEQSAIFDTYLLMLSDQDFFSQVRRNYDESGLNIEFVLHSRVRDFAERMRLSGDAYLRERADDVNDVFGRVLNELLNRKDLSLTDIPEGAVIAAVHLRPSDAIIITKRRPAALVLQEGGVSSHLAILARSYGIPSVFAVKDVLAHVATGQTLIVDAVSSTVIADPDTETMNKYADKNIRSKIRAGNLEKFRNKPAQTKDGAPVSLLANIGSPDEAENAVAEGAQGVGLFRTEFLFMNSGSFLTEDEQFEAYKRVLQLMEGKPVTIRTLDSGGDKIIAAQQEEAIKNEKNPLLGWRAIRFCLDRTDIFKIQLRALYRASVFGTLKIMFPLVTDYEQIAAALKLVDEVKQELRAQNIPFNADVPVGIMIETASAAVVADTLASQCGFFSIGTNDLTQYVLGVDRENTHVAHLYDEFNLAVLRLIKQTITAGQAAGIPVAVCGEMASRPEGAIMLLGLGVRSLSMSPSRISAIKELLSRHTLADMSNIAAHAFLLSSGAKIRRFVLEAAGKEEL